MGQTEIAVTIKPKMIEQIIKLFTPKHDFKTDPPFQQVVEQRQSIRSYSEKPITAQQLGEFLYRSARVKTLNDKQSGKLYAHTKRTYPGGGAIYELELYLTINRCDGLVEGLYHYDPLNHELELINTDPDKLNENLQLAMNSAVLKQKPDLLMTITARFSRLNWKYESMAYAAILKNVGVLYQNFYLTATAMDLAPCGIGGGDSMLFAKLAGLNYYEETSVGEFLLGNK